MNQCVAPTRATGERCGMDALEGRDQCGLHGNMPLNHAEVCRLKEEAYRVGHVVIDQHEHRALMDDRERYRQSQAKTEKRSRDLGWGTESTDG